MRRLIAAAGPFYVFAGVMHFVIPKTYMRIMPRRLPAHRELVYASGVAEIVGGVALMHPDPAVRRLGGYFETATMLAVFPANLNMYVNADDYAQIPKRALLARLPVQILFIAWAL
ncbi:MAG: hypothetical protein QOI80_1868, partial [Solirubrobacteraceae bacterium]|nr:hypothetical protein [Solirubrobacteraceae bacterium]